MKTRTFVLSVLALCVGGLAVAPGDVARADEKARAGVWVFDVRMVRVDPALPEGAEKMSVFEEAEGTTVPMGWPQILAALKKRGKTTILVDQRFTTMDGVKGTVTNVREIPIVMVNFTDKHNTQKRQASVKSGCTFDVTCDPSQMRYRAEARWTLSHHPIQSSEGPPQLLTAWEGVHPPLNGDTLVLHYREQIDAFGIEGVKPVELYALITGRFIAR